MADTKWKMFDSTVVDPLLAWTFVPEDEIYNSKYIHGIALPAPVANRVLFYDGAAFSWVPEGVAAHALGSHTNVDAPAPNDKDVLTFNNGTGKWEASPTGAVIHDNTFHSTAYAADSDLTNHVNNVANPHVTTALQVGAEPSGSIDTHNALDTGVHGVGASTVESTSGSAAKVSAHNVNTGVHGVGASTIASVQNILDHGALTTGTHGVGVGSDIASVQNITDHSKTKTGIHGIDAASPSKGDVLVFDDGTGTWYNSNAFDQHVNAASAVHGIASGNVESTTGSALKVTTHAAITHSVHGVGASGFEDKGNKGGANGYCGLDASSKVATANLGGAGADATKFLRGDRTWAVLPQWTEKTKTGNQTSSSTTPAAITDLQMKGLTAGKRYLFEATLIYSSNTAGVGGHFGVNGSVAATTIAGSMIAPISGTAQEQKYFTAYISAADGLSFSTVPATNTPIIVHIEGQIMVGASATDLDLMFAVEYGAAATITVYAGSIVRYRQVT